MTNASVNHVSRATLAKMAGVSRAAITKACRTQLAPACIGPRVDIDHPSTKEYLSNRTPAPTKVPDSLTREEFDAIVDAVFRRVVARLRQLLKGAG